MYLLSDDVNSPQHAWNGTLVVIYDGNERGRSYASGAWYDDECIAARRNGSDSTPGYSFSDNPTARRPTWFVLTSDAGIEAVARVQRAQQATDTGVRPEGLRRTQVWRNAQVQGGAV